MPDEAQPPPATRPPHDPAASLSGARLSKSRGPADRSSPILAFDFGQRRIGVACGDTVSRTATPLGAVLVGGPRWMAAVDSLIRDWRPSVLVIGLPYNVDGSESAASLAARNFAGELAERYALPVELIDERYSSLEAEARLRSARQSGSRKRRVSKIAVDSAAACVILERWLTEKP